MRIFIDSQLGPRTVLDEAVQIVNFVKCRPQQSRLLKIICEDMGSQHTTLFLHAEVWWLLRGKTLVRVFELPQELDIYLSEQKHQRLAFMSILSWLMRLAYLAYIFTKLNEVNFYLQGGNVSV